VLKLGVIVLLWYCVWDTLGLVSSLETLLDDIVGCISKRNIGFLLSN
jgi:hypothetical protein